ncbi:MAG: DUF2182 domain-containing protein, partial [Gemmatimonadetes bacterium]|nr:DUF2182 domain-containing protein [Gemmatimonadota bacterium]
MGEMSGGATAMMWTRMPGHSWAGTAASFLAMWVAMMAAMMLPSLVPALWRYRECVRRAGCARANACTARAGAGYFAVWAAVGAIVFPFGAAAYAAAAQHPSLARHAPILAGVAVLLAGVVQHSAWKTRRLVVCRESSPRDHAPAVAPPDAWRHGV